MEINMAPGKYVVAVSGGVDSMALLNMLSKLPNLDLVAAHFNHGIRADSGEDELLVKQTAQNLGLPFEAGAGRLGKNASEEAARAARYTFLEKIRAKHQAKAIITAHHQDDLIETAFINLLRGTGRRGLAAIMLNPNVIRPLLNYPKSRLILYAKEHKLQWREDATNQEDYYLRNYIRQKILPKLTEGQRQELVSDITKTASIEAQTNGLLADLSKIIAKNGEIDRSAFAGLPANLGNELVTYWLRQYKAGDFDKKTVQRLNTALRTSRPGTQQPVKQRLKLQIAEETARFLRI